MPSTQLLNEPFIGATEAEADYMTYLGQLTWYFVRLLFDEKHHASLMELPLTGPNGLRQQLGELAVEYFARAYFPEYFWAPIGDFHRNAYNEVSFMLNNPAQKRRWVRIWPRSFAKSTIFNFFAPSNAVLYRKRPFILQVSDTDAQAMRYLADIRNSMEENDRIIEDFGHVKGRVWKEGTLEIKTSKGNALITAVGAGSSVRGIRVAQFRPQLITVDDLENDQAVETPERIDKLHRWFTKALLPIGDATTDMIYVGTILAYESVLDRVSRDPAWHTEKYSAIIQPATSHLWDDWEKMRTDLSIPANKRIARAEAFYDKNKAHMDADHKVLWPEGWPYKALMEKKLEIGDLSFQAEYQNEPIDPADCIFDRAWFKYYDDDFVIKHQLRFTEYIGAVDPSLGKSRLGDYTAIVTLGRAEDGFIYVIDATLERMPPDRIVEVILEKAKQYNYKRFGVEVNLFQELLKLELQREAARKHIYLPIAEMRHNKDKVIRVQSLVPYVKNGYIKFKGDQRLLLDQLAGFPKIRHDDGPDCLEMAVRLMGNGITMQAGELGVDPGGRNKGRYYGKDFDEDDVAGYTWVDM